MLYTLCSFVYYTVNLQNSVLGTWLGVKQYHDVNFLEKKQSVVLKYIILWALLKIGYYHHS